MFEIFPLFLAIMVVTLPKLPGWFLRTTFNREFETVFLLTELSQEIFNHLSGLSLYDDSVSQSTVWTATPIPAVTMPTIVSPFIGEQHPDKWYYIPAVSPFNFIEFSDSFLNLLADL